MKNDTDISNGEFVGTSWFQLGNSLYMHVANFPTFIAHDVMMIFNIRIKSNCSVAHIDELDLAHLGEFIESLIDGSQRNSRQFGICHRVNRLSRWMRFVVMQKLKQQFTLRSDFATLLTKY